MWKSAIMMTGLCLVTVEGVQLLKMFQPRHTSTTSTASLLQSELEILQRDGAPADEILALAKQLLGQVRDEKEETVAKFDENYGSCETEISTFAAAVTNAEGSAQTAGERKQAASDAAAPFLLNADAQDKVQATKNAEAAVKDGEIETLDAERATSRATFEKLVTDFQNVLAELKRLRLIAQDSALHDRSTHVNELGAGLMELSSTVQVLSPDMASLVSEAVELAAKATPSELDSIYNLMDQIRDRIKDSLEDAMNVEELAVAQFNSDKAQIINDVNTLREAAVQAAKNAAAMRESAAAKRVEAAQAMADQVGFQATIATKTQQHASKTQQCTEANAIHEKSLADADEEIAALEKLVAAINESGGLTAQLADGTAAGNATSDIGLDYKWVPTAWRECSKTCGGGKKNRDVDCRTDNAGLKNMDEQLLCQGDTPTVDEVCNTVLCCSGNGVRSADDTSCTCNEFFFSADADTCSACADGCSTCESADKCTKAADGFWLNGNKSQACTSSIDKCAVLTVCGGSTDAQCAAAVDGYFADANGDTQECAVGCAKCTGLAACAETISNYALVNSVPVAYAACPGRQFERQPPTPTSQTVCEACVASCAACTSSGCTVADDGFILVNGAPSSARCREAVTDGHISCPELNACLRTLGAAFSNVQFIEVAYGRISYLDKICNEFGYGAYRKPFYSVEPCHGAVIRSLYPSYCSQGWLGAACRNYCGSVNYLGFICTRQGHGAL